MAKYKKIDPVEQEKIQQNLTVKVQELREKFPSFQVEVWFFDEHQVGLKPIIRKVWASIGERLSALGHHR